MRLSNNFMSKLKDIKFVAKGINQNVKGKSLIHRCCKAGMIKIGNNNPWHQGEYFVCSKGCGKIELPYIAQLCGHDEMAYLADAYTQVTINKHERVIQR